MKSLLGRGASTCTALPHFSRNGLASSRPKMGTRTRHVYVEEELRLTIRITYNNGNLSWIGSILVRYGQGHGIPRFLWLLCPMKGPYLVYTPWSAAYKASSRLESRRIKRIVNDHSTLDIELDRVYTRTIRSGPWHTTFLMAVMPYEGTVLGVHPVIGCLQGKISVGV